MLWRKKKKRKKATKPKAVTQTAAPQQPVEEIPQTTKSEKKEETPKQKKPAGGKYKKVLSLEKVFLDTFGRLTNRQRITGLRRYTSRLFGLRDDSSGGADGWRIH